jgi:tRNA-specific 2-thiouridylase
VSTRIGFPHYIVNFERQFRETVISNFVQEYAAGRTPLPCAHCNSDLKFATLLDRARGFDARMSPPATTRASSGAATGAGC